MLILNLNNVESLIFYDSNLIKKFPEFQDLFNQWKLSIMVPSLKSLKMRSITDFLQKTNNEHLKILEKYFDQKVTIDKSIDCKSVSHLFGKIGDIEDQLNDLNLSGNVTVSRNKDEVFVSIWR